MSDTQSQDFPIEQGYSASPNKVWREDFHGRWGLTVLGKFIGGLFYMEGEELDHGKGRGVSKIHFPAI